MKAEFRVAGCAPPEQLHLHLRSAAQPPRTDAARAAPAPVSQLNACDGAQGVV